MSQEKYKNKFVIVYDTICDGEQCTKNEDNSIKLFDSYDKAFKEIFDDAHSMLSNRTDDELEEYNDGITADIVDNMGFVLESGDVKAMELFFSAHPNANDNNEWVMLADEFIDGRKTIFVGQ